MDGHMIQCLWYLKEIKKCCKTFKSNITGQTCFCANKITLLKIRFMSELPHENNKNIIILQHYNESKTTFETF